MYHPHAVNLPPPPPVLAVLPPTGCRSDRGHVSLIPDIEELNRSLLIPGAAKRFPPPSYPVTTAQKGFHWVLISGCRSTDFLAWKWALAVILKALSDKDITP